MLNSSQLQLAGMFPNKTNRSWSELLKTSSGWNLLCVFCSATVKDFGEEINELKQLKGGLLPAEPPKAQRLNWTNTHEICIHAPQPEGFPSPGCFSSALGWWRSPSRAPKTKRWKWHFMLLKKKRFDFSRRAWSEMKQEPAKKQQRAARFTSKAYQAHISCNTGGQLTAFKDQPDENVWCF